MFSINFKICSRYLANSNWDCPIPSYSKPFGYDYPTAKSQCGKFIWRFFFWM